MKSIVAIVAVIVLALGVYFMAGVNMAQDARYPDVSLDVEGGRLPKVEVTMGEVDVTEENIKLKVPVVDAKTAGKITTPELDVTSPAEKTNWSLFAKAGIDTGG